MKNIILLLMGLCAIVACKSPKKESAHLLSDNEELKKMYEADQSDRRPQSGTIDWEVVLPRDSVRLTRAFELVKTNKVQTAKDYYHAAVIFQHGYDTIASGMAVMTMKKAVALDTTINKWLLAAAIDRDLQRRSQPQIFGTQFTKNEKGLWVLYNIDTTKITDAQRRAHNVSSLSSLRKQAAKMNK